MRSLEPCPGCISPEELEIGANCLRQNARLAEQFAGSKLGEVMGRRAMAGLAGGEPAEAAITAHEEQVLRLAGACGEIAMLVDSTFTEAKAIPCEPETGQCVRSLFLGGVAPRITAIVRDYAGPPADGAGSSR